MASRDIIRHRTPLSGLVDVLTVAFLAAFLVWTVLPLVIMVVSSFKDLLEAFALPPVGKWSEIGLFFNFTPTFKHYVSLFQEHAFGAYLANSLIASVGSAIVLVV